MIYKRFIPLLILLLLMFLGWLLGITEYVSFQEIKKHREEMLFYTTENRTVAAFLFIGAYTLVTALSIPVAVYMTLIGGFLFPQPLSTLLVIIGATTGASILYFAATTAFRGLLKQRAGPFLKKVSVGFQENAVSYLLFLRLTPAFPFWLVNIAPAFFGIPFFTFFWTTAVGITPGVFVYTQLGTGLGAIFDSGDPFSLDGLLNTDVKIAFLALGIFALIPTAYRYWRKRKKQ